MILEKIYKNFNLVFKIMILRNSTINEYFYLLQPIFRSNFVFLYFCIFFNLLTCFVNVFNLLIKKDFFFSSPEYAILKNLIKNSFFIKKFEISKKTKLILNNYKNSVKLAKSVAIRPAFRKMTFYHNYLPRLFFFLNKNWFPFTGGLMWFFSWQFKFVQPQNKFDSKILLKKNIKYSVNTGSDFNSSDVGRAVPHVKFSKLINNNGYALKKLFFQNYKYSNKLSYYNFGYWVKFNKIKNITKVSPYSKFTNFVDKPYLFLNIKYRGKRNFFKYKKNWIYKAYSLYFKTIRSKSRKIKTLKFWNSYWNPYFYKYWDRVRKSNKNKTNAANPIFNSIFFYTMLNLRRTYSTTFFFNNNFNTNFINFFTKSNKSLIIKKVMMFFTNHELLFLKFKNILNFKFLINNWQFIYFNFFEKQLKYLKLFNFLFIFRGTETKKKKNNSVRLLYNLKWDQIINKSSYKSKYAYLSFKQGTYFSILESDNEKSENLKYLYFNSFFASNTCRSFKKNLYYSNLKFKKAARKYHQTRAILKYFKLFNDWLSTKLNGNRLKKIKIISYKFTKIRLLRKKNYAALIIKKNKLNRDAFKFDAKTLLNGKQEKNKYPEILRFTLCNKTCEPRDLFFNQSNQIKKKWEFVKFKFNKIFLIRNNKFKLLFLNFKLKNSKNERIKISKKLNNFKKRFYYNYKSGINSNCELRLKARNIIIFKSNRSMKFLTNHNGFLYLSKRNDEVLSNNFKQVTNAKKDFFSFSSQFEIHKTILKSYLKSRFLNLYIYKNKTNANDSVYYNDVYNFLNSERFNGSSAISYLEKNKLVPNLLFFFKHDNLFYTNTRDFKSDYLNKLNEVYASGLNSEVNFLPAEISIKRVKFKPGYRRIWKEARQILQKTINTTYRYQYRLTRYLLRQKHVTQFKTLIAFEMNIFILLSQCRVFYYKNFIINFIENGVIYINGAVCANINFQIYANDFIQLLINIKYYIIHKFLLNYILKKKIYSKQRIFSYLNSKMKNPEKKKSYLMPKWLLFETYDELDIPKYVELDFFTLSIFILYQPYTYSDINNPELNKIKTGVLNLYNWKYIT